jgi:hypothetical protein
MTVKAAWLLARWTVPGLATLGAVGVAPIAYLQFSGTKSCPSVWLVPACYLVLAGYLLIAAASLIPKKIAHIIFGLGWIPLFGMALTGSSLELLGQNACPKTQGGIATCFISLALLMIIALAFYLERRLRVNATK